MNIRLFLGCVIALSVLQVAALSAFEEEITVFQQVQSDISRGPFAYAGLVGMGMWYVTAPRNSKEGVFASLLLASFVYHGFVANSWIDLRAELLRLRQSHTSGSIYERTQWCGVPGYDTGYHMMVHFRDASYEDRNKIKKQLTLEMQVAGELEAQAVIEKGLLYYEKLLNAYADNSNMLLYLARAAGFKNDPRELLTSNYLVMYDFETLLRSTFDQHITGSWIARSFTIRRVWSKMLGITLPMFYTWNYKVASKCIWYTLKRYSCLKALLAIFEVVTVDQMNPSINVNLNHRLRV